MLIVPIFLFNQDTFTNTIKYLITMANDIIPQDLIIYRRILTTALATITNEMIANNALDIKKTNAADIIYKKYYDYFESCYNK